MKLTTSKCHLLKPGHKYEQAWSVIGEGSIWEASNVESFGIAQLKFDVNVSSLCSKINSKLHVLTKDRISCLVH